MKRGEILGELRKDYILDRYVIIATDRAKRPHEFKQKDEPRKGGTCFFCPGNEELTPEEKGRIPNEYGKWKMRWFDNKFAAVKMEGKHEISTDNEYFTFSDNYGEHEIIVETNEHKKQLWDLEEDEIKMLLEVYQQRIVALGEKENIKYVQVFKNHGIKGGTSLVHSHSQIISLNHVPAAIREEVEAAKKLGKCPYCEILNIEKESLRRCYENDDFVAFTPYASRFNFEIWVFPKKHIRTILESNELFNLALILKDILRKLRELNASFNMFLHNSPNEEDLHFHIEITPRISTWAGFEMSAGEYINIVSPEDAARFYRGEE